MGKKYALLIGNSAYSNEKLNRKAPSEDVSTLQSVLLDKNIGNFDHVKVVENASLSKMHFEIGEFFTQQHKPDDLLFFYYSGHGALDDYSEFYFLACDSIDGSMLPATGFDPKLITKLMNRARSQRQVVVLDCCYSGSYNPRITGKTKVNTEDVFSGNGTGQYILTASEDLRQTFVGSEWINESVKHSFFTYYLLEGLTTGEADLDGDGQIDIEELFEYIEGKMIDIRPEDPPRRFIYPQTGKLVLAKTPPTSAERKREVLNHTLLNAEQFVNIGDYRNAKRLLKKFVDSPEKTVRDADLFDQAKRLLERVQFEEERSKKYNEIREDLSAASWRLATIKWQNFIEDYPDFDPHELAYEIQALSGYESGQLSTSIILPAPFEWIDIPKQDFQISKYLITNAQFAQFVESGGYRNTDWWTALGWQYRLKKGLTAPQNWDDDKWNKDNHPVVGISWYEAIAFCLWLGQVTNHNVSLPTLSEWQYVAQGGVGNTFSWGNTWQCNQCNNSVLPCNSDGTVPVHKYERKSKHPFGVIDMTGHLWEWCLTDFTNNTDNIDEPAKKRVLCGGSWYNRQIEVFRTDTHIENVPDSRQIFNGFRIIMK